MKHVTKKIIWNISFLPAKIVENIWLEIKAMILQVIGKRIEMSINSNFIHPGARVKYAQLFNLTLGQNSQE